MRSLHILLVEDTPSYAPMLNQQLFDLEHTVCLTKNCLTSISSELVKTQPDLIFLCIDCDNHVDIIGTIKKINAKFSTPIIVVTKNIAATFHVKLMKEVAITTIINPTIDDITLRSILFNLHHQLIQFSNNQYLSGYLLIKDRNIYQNISFENIQWIQSDGNYVILQTVGKKYIVKQSLKKVVSMLDDTRFIKIQKSYVVRADLLDSIDIKTDRAYMGEKEFPIGRSFKDELLQKYRILK